MLFENRRRFGRDGTHELISPHGRARGGRSSIGWLVRRVCKSMVSLVTWLSLIVAGGTLGAGYFSFRGCDRQTANPEEIAAGPIRTDIQRYSGRFIIAVKKSVADERDLLADYETFAAVWAEVSPEQPMLLKLVSPASVDRASKKAVPPIDSPAVTIDEKSFAEYAPLLDEISTLILNGDGTGRGRLAVSGYVAEPADLN